MVGNGMGKESMKQVIHFQLLIKGYGKGIG